jgi:hypothetical protein
VEVAVISFDMLKLLGGTTVVAAAIVWLAQTTVSHLFAREMAHVTAAVARVEALAADLEKSRGEAYGKIWTLTGSLNLLGPAAEIGCAKLSAELKDWYFERGWVLTDESKRRYFLVQEVLGFLMVHSIAFRRPSDEQLFGGQMRPVALLRQLRADVLEIDPRDDKDTYAIQELEACVSRWKSRCLRSTSEVPLPEQAWILLQFVLSAFRSCMVDELGSRERVHKTRTAEG